MDPSDALPPEVMARVLELLRPAELTRCLAVSRGWRDQADSDRLWRPHSKGRGLLPAKEYDQECSGPLELCTWAKTYIGYMRRLVRNWSTPSFQSFQLQKDDWFCCIASCSSLVAVYYPRNEQVTVYNLDFGLDPISSVPVALPGGTAIPDVFVTDRHLVLSRGNFVVVYETTASGFRFRKSMVWLEEDGGRLVLEDSPYHPPPFLHSEKRLYVKGLEGDVIWLESNALYVVDMRTGTYRILAEAFRCIRFDNKRVFAANDEVSILSLEGEKQSRIEIRRVADLWVKGDYLAALIGWEEQRLELWRISDKAKICRFRVEKDPTVCLCPSLSKMYMLELGGGLERISCVSLETGGVTWLFSTSYRREPLVHPELRLLCDRFLFVRPSFLDDGNFLLLESSSGNMVYDSAMPPSLIPPSFIYHLSDELFITAESSLIHIRSYR